jgi:hypothetical protein
MEDKLTTTKTLNFVPLPKQIADPVLDRRTRIIAQLEEQKLLLAACAFLGKERTGREVLGRKKATGHSMLAKAA